MIKKGILIAVGFCIGLAVSVAAVAPHVDAVGHGYAPHAIAPDGGCWFYSVSNIGVMTPVSHAASHCGRD